MFEHDLLHELDAREEEGADETRRNSDQRSPQKCATEQLNGNRCPRQEDGPLKQRQQPHVAA
jgi:hypothetical protein